MKELSNNTEHEIKARNEIIVALTYGCVALGFTCVIMVIAIILILTGGLAQ